MESVPSLGWLGLRWSHAHLPSPANEHEPLLLTDEQASHLLDFYTLDSRGVFVYRRDIVERAKGWGKSPLAAVIALIEFVGPATFDGWAEGGEQYRCSDYGCSCGWVYTYQAGEPMGKPWPNPWVQVAAVSEDQTENTYGAIYELLTANEGLAAKNLGIDNGRTRLYLIGRPGRLEPVTASAGSREGQRLTFAVLDETHLWKSRNGGVRLAATIRRNVGKMGGRSIETTNAPQIGEKSVAERSGNDAARHSGILYYNTRPLEEPQPDWSDEQMLAALNVSYGDAHWIDRARILREIRDPATDWDDALRYYFNVRSVGIGHAVDPRRWDELARVRELPPGTYGALGFDGSISQDETWLIFCTKDGYSTRLGRWSRPVGDLGYSVPRHEVHDKIAWAFGYFNVGLFYFDPPKWWSEGEEWAAKYGDKRVLAFDTNQARRFAPAVDRWLVAIREGTHTHDGDPALADHIRAAHLKKVRDADQEDDGRTKYVIVKGEDRRKIDGCIADILAFEAAMTMPDFKPRRPRRMATL